MALLALALLTVASHATEADEIKELREQIRQLELKLLAIERRQELRDKEASAPAPAPIANAPKVTISEKGFAAASPDGANSIKLRGLLQLDSRLFMGDEALNNNASCCAGPVLAPTG
jgi:phosphate-selective porin OprO/OprP